MERLRWLAVLVLATLGGVRCSETPSDPSAISGPNTIPALIVSETLSLDRLGMAYYPPTLSTDGLHASALMTFDPGSADLRIHFAEPRQDGLSYLEHPTWSADGRSVAFEKYVLSGSCEPPACPMGIWVVGLEDGSARQLIPDMETPEGPDYWDRQPVWSRTGD